MRLLSGRLEFNERLYSPDYFAVSLALREMNNDVTDSLGVPGTCGRKCTYSNHHQTWQSLLNEHLARIPHGTDSRGPALSNPLTGGAENLALIAHGAAKTNQLHAGRRPVVPTVS